MSVSSISSIAVSGSQGSPAPRRPSRGTRRPQRRDEIYAPPGPPARGRGRLHGTHTSKARRVNDTDLDRKPSKRQPRVMSPAQGLTTGQPVGTGQLHPSYRESREPQSRHVEPMTRGSADRARSPRRDSRTDEPSRQIHNPVGTARGKRPSTQGETATKGGDASHRSQSQRRRGADIVGRPPVRDLVASRGKMTCPVPREARRAAREAPPRPEEGPPASPRPPLRAE